ARLRRLAPVSHLSMELVRFDTQKLQTPEIHGVEYQHGTLFGYEVREYLLEKWGRKCAYCDVEGVPLEIEHVVPRSKGGTDRVSNLTLACHRCNQAKGNRPIEEFLARDPQRLQRIKAQLKAPLKGAAVVNATRWALFRRLQATGLLVETGSGGRTKHNRMSQDYPKKHWIDAACVGKSGERVLLHPEMQVLRIVAKGHGKRQRCRTDKFGFPNRLVPRQKKFKGFQTGDMVRAVVPKGKYRGIHAGRVSVRTTGYFRVGTVDGISHRYCEIVHKADGYQYGF
uniref:RNA-guided endonuclease IscB n=1 Tax=Alicyclobacillus kakegawensis TaxID=392012 RepID=UPI000AF37378